MGGKKKENNVEVISFKNKSSPGIRMLVEPHSSCGTLNKKILNFSGTAYNLAIYFQLRAITFSFFLFF